MKFTKYLKDKIYAIIIFLITFAIILLLNLAFKVPIELTITVLIILLFCFFSILIIDYAQKSRFYNLLLERVSQLDQAYLVLETLPKPNCYEGKLAYDALYEIDKSMAENVSRAKKQAKDFQEYIELWLHEIKTPLAALMLKNMSVELEQIENYLEQVLYFSRCENSEKDFLIKKVNLNQVVKNVSLKHMESLLAHNIKFKVENVNIDVMTDAKWLEFILSQILNNSIKYRRQIQNPEIKISVRKSKNKTILEIWDNGIGIAKSDISQVFDKSFTGQNGRKHGTSTGMGLYIAKNICNKLGHKLSIESKEMQYTKVSLVFANNKFYEVS